VAVSALVWMLCGHWCWCSHRIALLTSSSFPHAPSRKIQESPDDGIRKMSKLTANKRCADCSSKLPSTVNLTFGTFVCLPCSGIHREFNHRVKGIGHSVFTAEDLARMRQPDAGNEAANFQYMAQFNPDRERLRQPEDNCDQQLLRVWIRRKYIDKAWYSANASGIGGSVSVGASGAPPRATVVKIPVQNAPAPANDLLDFGAAPAAPAPSAASWDAFGGQHQVPQDVAPAPNQPTPQQQEQEPPMFHANFGQMQQREPPAPAPAGPAQLAQHQQQPPMFQATFGQTQQEQPPATAGPIPSQQQPGLFQADFAEMQQPQPLAAAAAPETAPPPVPTQTVPQQQQPATFQANFGQMQRQQIQSTTPTLAPAPTAAPPSIPTQPALRQQQQQPATSQANFGQIEQPRPQTQVSAPPPPTQAALPEAQRQHVQAPVLQTRSGEVQLLQQPSADFHQSMGQSEPQVVPLDLVQATVPPMTLSPTATNVPRMDAAEQASVQMLKVESKVDDAFANVSLEPIEAISDQSLVPGGKLRVEPKFKEGDAAFYFNMQYDGIAAKIVKVHLDDDLVPFYDILLADGKEKQTDDGHLKLPSEQSGSSVMVDSTVSSELTKLIEKIRTLKPERLAKLQKLIDELCNEQNVQGNPQQTTVRNSQPTPSHSMMGAPQQNIASQAVQSAIPSVNDQGRGIFQNQQRMHMPSNGQQQLNHPQEYSNFQLQTAGMMNQQQQVLHQGVNMNMNMSDQQAYPSNVMTGIIAGQNLVENSLSSDQPSYQPTMDDQSANMNIAMGNQLQQQTTQQEYNMVPGQISQSQMMGCLQPQQQQGQSQNGNMPMPQNQQVPIPKQQPAAASAPPAAAPPPLPVTAPPRARPIEREGNPFDNF